MEFIFDILAEIIFEPIIRGYLLAMSHFSNGSKKVDEDKIKTIVVFEGVALFIMFVIGGIMLAESSGESLTGKILFISSIAVSVVQIGIGVILNIAKKKRTQKNILKIPVNHYKKSDKELFVNGGSLHIDGEKLVLKSVFKKIAVFHFDEMKLKKLSDEFLFKSVQISDYEKSYVLLLTKSNYSNLSESFEKIR